MSDKYLTAKEVAEKLCVDVSTVSIWIRNGDLPATNVCRVKNGERNRWRIAEDDLEKFCLVRRNAAALNYSSAKPIQRRIPRRLAART